MPFLYRWLPVVLWTALILSAANDSFSAERSGSWFRSIFGRDLPHVAHVVVRKAAHVLEYAILGALAWRARPRFRLPVALALAVATADETLQALTATRTGSPADVMLDVCAAVIAVAVCHRYRVRQR